MTINNNNFNIILTSTVPSSTLNTRFQLITDTSIDDNEIINFIKTGRVIEFDPDSMIIIISYINQNGKESIVHGKHDLSLHYLVERIRQFFIEFVIKVAKITN